jgi:hypothetical protein
MQNDYLPRPDAQFLAWLVNFKTQVNTIGPVVLGLTVADETALTAATDSLQTKLPLATDPATRGKKTIFEKDEAKRAAAALVRTLVRRVQVATGVTNDMRLALGINIPKPRTRRERPTVKPKIDLISREGTSVFARFHDGSGSKRGKPADVTELLVFSYVGPVAPLEPAEWTTVEVTGKTLVRVDFPTDLPAGTRVWITGCYRNAAGTGPGADPLGTVLAGGGTELPMAA